MQQIKADQSTIMAPIMNPASAQIMSTSRSLIMQSIMSPTSGSTTGAIMAPIMSPVDARIMFGSYERNRLGGSNPSSCASPIGAMPSGHEVFWTDEDRDCDFRSAEALH